MSPDDRVARARERLKKVVDRTSSLIALNQSNAIVTYSNILSKQIPASYAGHAFNLFRSTMHSHEIVMLCSLWDRPDQTLDQQSIPTVCALIDNPDVLAKLTGDVRGWYAGKGVRIHRSEKDPLSEEEHQELISGDEAQRGESDALKAASELDSTVDQIRTVSKSKLLTSVRNIRDKFLAHGLETTRAERRGEVVPMKYGDEKSLLGTTLKIVETLYLWVSGTHFDLAEVADINRRHAEELWTNCHFTIPSRQPARAKTS